MISNKEEKVLQTIISKYNFNPNFDKIRNQINYNKYLERKPINTFSLKLNLFKFAFFILLLCILIIPIITYGSPKMKNENETKRVISVDRENKCYLVIKEELSREKKLVIGCNNNKEILSISNIKIIGLNENVIYKESTYRNDYVLIDLLSIENFDIGDKISVYFEISGRNGKKLMEYSIIVECYKGSEGVRKYRFLY